MGRIEFVNASIFESNRHLFRMNQCTHRRTPTGDKGWADERGERTDDTPTDVFGEKRQDVGMTRNTGQTNQPTTHPNPLHLTHPPSHPTYPIHPHRPPPTPHTHTPSLPSPSAHPEHPTHSPNEPATPPTRLTAPTHLSKPIHTNKPDPAPPPLIPDERLDLQGSVANYG